MTPRDLEAIVPGESTPRVSLPEFDDNVRGILDLARRRGTRVILLAPPVNLFAPPLAVRVLANAAVIAKWCQAIGGRIDAGDPAGALDEIDDRLAADPHAFYARWLRGYALTQLGDLEGGTKELEAALGDNPFPDRCSRSYRDELARIAAETETAFVDTQALFRAKSGRLLDAMFIDHVHPNAAGHRAIAQALAAVIHGRE